MQCVQYHEMEELHRGDDAYEDFRLSVADDKATGGLYARAPNGLLKER